MRNVLAHAGRQGRRVVSSAWRVLSKDQRVIVESTFIAAISAWRSENVRTRSGFRSRIFRTSAETRFLAPCSGRAHDIARNADDAPLLAEQIERLDGFLSEANDPLGWEHWFLLTHDESLMTILAISQGRRPQSLRNPGILSG
jgi:hypothetical protein